MSKKKIPNVHPGHILLEDFMKPLKLSQYRVAKDMGVPPRRINEIVHGKRAVTADTALRLSKYFGTTAQFWLNLQTRHDLENAIDRSIRKIEREVHALPPSPRANMRTATLAQEDDMRTYSNKQARYLTFIYYYTKIHGVAPAEREMQLYFRTSPPSTHQMILTLAKRGLITRIPGAARSLRLTLSPVELRELLSQMVLEESQY